MNKGNFQSWNKRSKKWVLFKYGQITSMSEDQFPGIPVKKGKPGAEDLPGSQITDQEAEPMPEPGAEDLSGSQTTGEILNSDSVKTLKGNDGIKFFTGGREWFIPEGDIIEVDRKGSVRLYMSNGAINTAKPGEYEVIRKDSEKPKENEDPKKDSKKNIFSIFG